MSVIAYYGEILMKGGGEAHQFQRSADFKTSGLNGNNRINSKSVYRRKKINGRNAVNNIYFEYSHFEKTTIIPNFSSR